MAKLEIEIDGNVSGLQKAIQLADKELQRIDTNSQRVAQGIQRLTVESQKYEAQLTRLNSQLKQGVITENEYSKASEEITSKISETREEISVYQRELDRLNNSQRSRIQALESQSIAEEESKIKLEQNTGATVRNIQSVNSLRSVIITTILPTNQFSNSILRAGNSLSVLSNQAGGASKVLPLIGKSFLGPAGLALAASSALAFGISAITERSKQSTEQNDRYKDSVERLKKAQDDFNNSLEDTDRLLGQKVFDDFLREIGALEKTFVDTGNGSGFFVEKINENIDFLEDFGDRVKTLRRGELELFKKFFTVELVEAQRTLANLDSSSLEAILTTDKVKGFEEALGLVNGELQLFIDAENRLKKSIDSTNQSIEEQTQKTGLLFDIRTKIRELEDKRTFATDERELGLITQRIEKYTKELQLLEKRAELLSRPITEEIQLADPTRATDFLGEIAITIPDEAIEKFEKQKQIYLNGINQISTSFAGLGVDVAGVFGNMGQSQERFLRSFINFAGQIIAQQFAISQGYAIQGGFAAGAATGPAAPIVTPGLIAAGLSLVASSFGLLRNNRGTGAGSGVGSGIASNISGSGATAFEFDRRIELFGNVVVEGEKLVFGISNYQNYRN